MSHSTSTKVSSEKDRAADGKQAGPDTAPIVHRLLHRHDCIPPCHLWSAAAG